MQIKDSHHVFIAGQNGSGKTYLAKHVAARLAGLKIILDTKNTYTWKEGRISLVKPEKVLIVYNLYDFKNKLDFALDNPDKVESIIYKPDFSELNINSFNYFFQLCYFAHKHKKFKTLMVMVDEVMSITPNPSKIPEYYKAILTRGRELKVTVWSLSQRPATIPIVIYSESAHWFIFNLVQPDRKRLTDFTGFKEFMENIPKFSCWYYNTQDPKKPILAKI